jgi:type I restriction enzyme M protein
MAETKNNDSELEKKLWKAADKLRSNMDAAEYKHVVLGLIFLKYIKKLRDKGVLRRVGKTSGGY